MTTNEEQDKKEQEKKYNVNLLGSWFIIVAGIMMPMGYVAGYSDGLVNIGTLKEVFGGMMGVLIIMLVLGLWSLYDTLKNPRKVQHISNYYKRRADKQQAIQEIEQ